MDTLIRANSVRKTYRLGRVSVPVLRGASLEVGQGECVAVLGASGSGKSTLLHLLGGLDRPDRAGKSGGSGGPGGGGGGVGGGEIVFRDRALRGFSAGEMDRYRNLSVGFVFQFYHLLPELPVIENATIGAMVGKGRLRWARERAGVRARAVDLLGRFGLGERLRHRPAELSGGERQRVAIARALMNRPQLLLADEPTGNLDEKTGNAILDALMALRAETGLTTVMVTHDERVAKRADRIVRLKDGVVEAGGQAG